MSGNNYSLSLVLDALAHDESGELAELGRQIGKLYTDSGFPIDMALSRLPHDNSAKLAILSGALHEVVQHKRRSGATEKAIERTRAANQRALERFVERGETDYA